MGIKDQEGLDILVQDLDGLVHPNRARNEDREGLDIPVQDLDGLVHPKQKQLEVLIDFGLARLRHGLPPSMMYQNSLFYLLFI